MKKLHLSSAIFAFIAFLGLAVSCAKFERPIDPDPTPVPPTEEEAPKKFVPYETLHIEVPDSTYRVIYVGATKVATCYHTCDVIVPKLGALTKADADDYTIIDVHCAPNTELDSENTMQMVLAFEDTKTGDHDYNDLIIQARVHVLNKIDGTCKAELDIVPIAYGAAKKIGLGIGLVGPDNTYAEKELYSDCRSQLFKSSATFINTGRDGNRTKYQPVSMDLSTDVNGQVTAVTWFINVDGTKLYASNTFKLCVDEADMPQGLVLIDLRSDEYFYMKNDAPYYCGNEFWQYPLESVNISKVYSGFENAFITRGDFSVLATPTGKDYYNAIMDEDGEIDPEVCLYDVFDSTPTVDGIQLWEGGPIWATCNVGASSPEEYGLFFTWGNLYGYPCEGEICEFNFTPTVYMESKGYELTDSFESGDINYDAARFVLGGSWRTPTTVETGDLISHTTREIVHNYNGTGVSGYLLTSKTIPGAELFFPFSGYVKYNDHYCYTIDSPWACAQTWTCGICDYARNNATTLLVGSNQEGSKAANQPYGRTDGAFPIRAVHD